MKYIVIFLLTIFYLPLIANSPYFLVFNIHSKNSRYNQGVKGTVSVIQKQQNNEMKIIAQYPVMYGLKGAGKEREGDNKTPIGIYLIRELKIKGKRSWRKFGGYSIHLNYPNWYDQKLNRTGNYIAIHGGRVSYTNGCPRVLDGSLKKPKFGSKNITKIAKLIQQWKTPVILVENCPNTLLGNTNAVFSKSTIKFWLDIIKNQPSRAALKNRLLNYEHKILLESSSIYAKKAQYSHWNLIDGLNYSAWVLNPSDDKRTITYNFTETLSVRKLKIKIGYDKVTSIYDRWKENSRPSIIRLHFDNGQSLKIHLKDTKDFQIIPFSTKKIKSVRVEILDTFLGTKYPNDICISEMYFM